MSPNRQPSPVQPPILSSYADSMAQVRQAPSLPTLNNFTGYAATHSSPDYHSSFPGPTSHADRHTSTRLPPIQLPPLGSAQPQQPSSDPFSIRSLLSRPDSPGRKISQQQPRPQLPSFRPPSNSPASSYSDSPHERTSQLPSYPPTQRHYLDQPPPSATRGPPQPFPPQHQPQAIHQGWQFPPLPGRLDQEQLRHNPSLSTPTYNRSHYSGSSEPSPSTTALPPFPPSFSNPLPPVNYRLSIRQQPAAARACGFGERDRRVIDPPPILELKITEKTTGEPAEDINCILALHCSLLNHDGSEDNDSGPGQDGTPASRRLMGTVVASPYQAKDENGIAGTFFVFPDLSCRSPGKYRLRFKLLRVDIPSMKPGGISPTVASDVSDIFSVYTAKDFPGMRASSGLLKALRRQGLNVGVKKGSDARKGSKKTKKEESASSEEESDNGDEEGGKRGGAASQDGSGDEAGPQSGRKGKRKKTTSR
ncbi:uncharacterized protein LTR77_001860 [Saxophila tyrrhenica]|uniref:Velvet domain-containing protein n=1 Tax=Saxophila tyrrhenica TaxID=1690608 RepID=A0AAV9PR13_9PEZI|nr:hypothetical protein LTR77_001860 [Saxophila tyrrhenica]